MPLFSSKILCKLTAAVGVIRVVFVVETLSLTLPCWLDVWFGRLPVHVQEQVIARLRLVTSQRAIPSQYSYMSI